MPHTPCDDELIFISDHPEDQRDAIELCQACPFVDNACRELGMGETTNVYGGMGPLHRDRRAFRKEHRGRKDECRNGHSIEDYGVIMEGPGHQLLKECRRCAALRLHIATTDGTVPMPETPKKKMDTIVRHGGEAGTVLTSVGEDPCRSCEYGYSVKAEAYNAARPA